MRSSATFFPLCLDPLRKIIFFFFPSSLTHFSMGFIIAQMMDEEATLTEIQSIRQKMVEAYHIQRQYKTILDVISGERIGYESQLTDLEKSTADSKLEASKLKVSFSSFI